MKKYITLSIVLYVMSSLCWIAPNKNITTFANKSNLNAICVKDKVYNLNIVDSGLRNNFKKIIPEQYTNNFAVVEKSSQIVLYQIGCVKRSGFMSCTHNSKSYLFFANKDSVYLINDLFDKETPISIVEELTLKKLIKKREKKKFIEKINLIINFNSMKNENW